MDINPLIIEYSGSSECIQKSKVGSKSLYKGALTQAARDFKSDPHAD